MLAFAGNEAIAHSFLPTFRILTLTNDDVYTVLFLIERLAGSLNTIANYSYNLILEDLLRLGKWKFLARYHVFVHSTEI